MAALDAAIQEKKLKHHNVMLDGRVKPSSPAMTTEH
jgi:hypothetical protein